MKSQLITQLFRAIASEDRKKIRRTMDVIIASEKDAGHSAVAYDLESAIRSMVEVDEDNLAKVSHLLTLRTAFDNIQKVILEPSAQEQFDILEREYAARELLAKHRLPYTQKILLYGPPGCGKSLSTANLAKKLKLPCATVRLDAVIDSYLGNTAKNLRAVFDFASAQPTLLFIDECDVLFASREIPDSVREMKRCLNVLLQLMDEFPSDNGSIIVTATNLEKHLDFALWRRFDATIRIGMPSKEIVQNLLTSNFDLIGNFDWEKLLSAMDNLSHCEITKLAQRADKKALLDNCGLDTHYLQDAIAQYLLMKARG